MAIRNTKKEKKYKYQLIDRNIYAVVWNTANMKEIREFLGTSFKIEENDEILTCCTKRIHLTVKPLQVIIRNTSVNNVRFKVIDIEEFENTYERVKI